MLQKNLALCPMSLYNGARKRKEGPRVKEVLLVDCCVRREESRTARLARAFVKGLDEAQYTVSVIRPDEERMRPLTRESLRERDRLLAEGALGRPRFDYAKQFAGADVVVFAAPFWDMSFPALLKIYVENISVEGITFRTTEQGGRPEGPLRGQDAGPADHPGRILRGHRHGPGRQLSPRPAEVFWLWPIRVRGRRGAGHGRGPGASGGRRRGAGPGAGRVPVKKIDMA